MKPFGSHRPSMPVKKLEYMIAPEDFYMNFVVKHKPVVFKGMFYLLSVLFYYIARNIFLLLLF